MDFDPDVLSTEDLVGIIGDSLGFDVSELDRPSLLALFPRAVSAQNHVVEDMNPPPAPTQHHHDNINNLETLQSIENDLNLNNAMSESMIEDVLFSQRQHAAMAGTPPSIQSDQQENNTNVFDGSDMDYSRIDEQVEDSNNAMQVEETSTETLTTEQESSIALFCSIADVPADTAKYLLEAAGWDVETAVALHLDGNTPTPRPPPPRGPVPEPRVVRPPVPPPPSSSTGTSINIEDIMRRFASAEGDPANITAMIDMLHRMQQEGGQSAEDINNQFRRMHAHVRHFHGRGEDDDDEEDVDPNSPGRMVDEYDEEGIRRPDPVRLQRLVSSNSVDYRYEAHGTVEDPSVDWMFERPDDINFPGTLEQAREKAEAENKWVLVNIQSHKEFMCQLLNRDTWSNENLRELINASFLFWQRGATSEQGKRYMQLYKLNEDNLPHIAIISPQTGAKITTWFGFIEPTDLLDKLFEFLDKQSKMKKKSAAIPSPDQQPVAEEPSKPIESPEDKVAEKHAEDVKASEASKVIAVDFGPVPPEPQDGDTIKISLQLATGKPIVRKYLKTDLVRSLFAVAVNADAANAITPFDLITRIPAKSLSTCLDKTLVECELAGAKVFHVKL